MITSLLALIIGFILDCILGERFICIHPIVLIGKLIDFLEKILRKVFSKSKTGELIAGFFLVVFVITISTLISFFVLCFVQKINIGLRLIIESIMCWQIIAPKSLKKESMKVYNSLKNKNLKEARYNISMIVGRDTANLDDKGITKAAVETVAENSCDGVIAPIIYIAIGGAWLGFFYKAVNTMDSMVAYKNKKYMYFGRCAAFLDDILNFIPSRISAILLIISSKFLKLDTKNAFKIWKRDRLKHESPNSAQTESACAGALQIQLAGNAVYGGILHKKEFIGDDIRPIEYKDIIRVNRLMYVSTYICLLIFSMIKLAIILGGILC